MNAQLINQQKTVHHQEKKGLVEIETYFSSHEDNEPYERPPPRYGTERGERIPILHPE